MKKLFNMSFLAALIICGYFTFLGAAQTSDSTDVYALVITSDAVLYRTASDSKEAQNVYFYLPETYFVKLIEPAGELMYKAEYDGVTGFVRMSDIDIKDYEPKSKYPLDLALRVAGDINLNVRAHPSTQSAILATLPYGAGAVKYYNYFDGEEITVGNTRWYYISMTLNQTQIQGYVYSGNIELLNQIHYPNDLSPAPNQTTDPGADNKSLPYDAITQGIFIASVSIPAILIVYLLFRPSKNKGVVYKTTDSPYTVEPYVNDPYNRNN